MNAGMRAYYDARAAEYDEWWLGTGLFARRDRPGWEDDVAALCTALAALTAARTLDVACGTGFLTRHLPGDVTGLDQSAEMLEIAATRVAHVVQGDALAPPFADGEFERVVTSHFYGHLAEAQRSGFLARARRLAGELVVVDSARRPDGDDEAWQERTLNDGTRHSVYKRWFSADGLARELGSGEIVHAGPWFVAVRTTW
jgi:demethylmenaquinone methyltransferase/2-methoxy-6-polyprenyl-1,4-benzoquinol methylase